MIDFKTDFAVYSWIGSIVTAILSATFTIAFQTYPGFSLSNDNVAKLKAILERVQRRTQRPKLGRNHKIIRWLQERISGKS